MRKWAPWVMSASGIAVLSILWENRLADVVLGPIVSPVFDYPFCIDQVTTFSIVCTSVLCISWNTALTASRNLFRIISVATLLARKISGVASIRHQVYMEHFLWDWCQIDQHWCQIDDNIDVRTSTFLLSHQYCDIIQTSSDLIWPTGNPCEINKKCDDFYFA